MNDSRIWKCEMNEARQEEVARHFVGDSLCCWCQLPDRMQVVGTKAAQSLLRHCWNCLGYGAAAGSADLLGQSCHVAEFASTENLRVAREDLLNQRRAGPRHANDKDRYGGRISKPLLLVHQTGSKNFAHPLEPAQGIGLIVGYPLPHKRVPLEHVLKRLCVSAQIAIGLAKRKVEINLLLFVERAKPLCQFLHRGKMRVVLRKSLGIGQIPVGARFPG